MSRWSLKPGDLVIAKAAKVKRRDPPPAIMLYNWRTNVYHPWKNGNMGMIIDLDPKTEGVIVMAAGNVEKLRSRAARGVIGGSGDNR
jgi:hypothetical protein